MCGALCVMMDGTVLMPLWCVDSWDTLLKVRKSNQHPVVVEAMQSYLKLNTLPTDAVAFSSARFGAGTGTIYLDNVGCTGSENNLINCSRSSTVTCTLGHSEDAGVRCQG